MNSIQKIESIAQDESRLIDGWIEAEANGEQFPVDFDLAWVIAGYSKKSNAKRKLTRLKEGRDFSSDLSKTSLGGRPSDSIKMTCDAFKHFCLAAETEKGDLIRDYFIDAEKKWRLVQQKYPAIAQEVEQELEVLKIKQQIAMYEAQKAQSEQKAIELRHYVVTVLPEPVQQKILGYQEVVKIEYRDRIIKDDQIINDGSTINKTDLCRRYGLLTRNGKPDYKQLNYQLDKLGITDMTDAWEPCPVIQHNLQLKRDILPLLDKKILAGDRQRFLGE